MSTTVSQVIDDAAMAFGDPNKQRVETPHWLSIYNRANRELGEKLKIFRFIDEFDLLRLDPDTGEMLQKYAYPDGMVVMNGIHVSETPSDRATYRWIGEIFEDEFRDRTSGLYPTATIPDSYYATSAWVYLVPAVTADIVDGACIDYFGLPQDVTDVSTNMQAPGLARDYLLRRMVVHAMMATNRVAEANAELELWNADMTGLQDKLEDRSNDRRASLAPRRPRYQGMR